MSEAYKELLIKQKENGRDKVIGFTMAAIAGLSCAAAILFHPLAFIPAILFAILSYVLYFRKMHVEYEYIYMDKELRIDRIYNQSKRKRVATLDLSKLDIMAKKGSSALSSHEGRDCKTMDFSTGMPDTEELQTYVMYYSGTERYLLSLSDEVVKTMRVTMPHKIKVENY